MAGKFASLAQIILGLLSALLVLVVLSFSALFLQSYREYEYFKSKELELEKQLSHLKEKISQKEKYLDLVLHEPDFLERVVRQKLGYARPEETIYRFEKEDEPE